MTSGQARARAIALVATAIAACSSPAPPPTMGKTGSYRLTTDGPTTFGMSYGEIRPLAVRYLDADGRPLPGARVRFRIFGDPMGSTLSADRADTDGDGAASVDLAAGAAEAQFRVVAAAENAPDLELDVSVSRFDFVELDVGLSYAGADLGSVASVEALIYGDRRCQALPAAPAPGAGALRTAGHTGSTATLPFTFLLAVSYAIVGRALDAAGHLVAYGCVDVAQAQLRESPVLSVAVPLARVRPSVEGEWKLFTDVPAIVPASQGALFPAWQALVACPLAPASAILDGMEAALGSDPAAAHIAAGRAPVDASGCRGAQAMGQPTLDRQLADLLSASGAGPLSALPDVVATLDAVASHATLESVLTIAPSAGDGSWLASHRLVAITFTDPQKASVRDDLASLPLPVVVADGVRATQTGAALTLAEHGFTLRLPSLWQMALVDLGLAPRRLPTTARALLAAIVAAATRGDHPRLTGCAAVEDLLCQGTSGGCSLQAACESALDGIAARLDASFETAGAIDLTLAGSALVIDHAGDLVADELSAGTFQATVWLTPSQSASVTLPFRGTRAR